MTMSDVLTGIETGTESCVQTELLEELESVDLRWRAPGMVGYEPLRSWIELDLLLMRMGTPDFEYVIVESLATGRWVQTMGDPEALIIEVCGDAGASRAHVWRLRRAPGDRLSYAELAATQWEGGIDLDSLFTVDEARRVFREWLRGGSATGASLDPVKY